MTKIHYVSNDGAMRSVEAEDGMSVMQAAVTNGIEGIVGECGGQAMCATCHVYVEDKMLGLLSPMEAFEDEMLEFAAAPREHNSRLSCQIRIAPELDGLRVVMPETQR